MLFVLRSFIFFQLKAIDKIMNLMLTASNLFFTLLHRPLVSNRKLPLILYLVFYIPLKRANHRTSLLQFNRKCFDLPIFFSKDAIMSRDDKPHLFCMCIFTMLILFLKIIDIFLDFIIMRKKFILTRFSSLKFVQQLVSTLLQIIKTLNFIS